MPLLSGGRGGQGGENVIITRTFRRYLSQVYLRTGRRARKFYTEKQNKGVQGEKHRSIWGNGVSLCGQATSRRVAVGKAKVRS